MNKAKEAFNNPHLTEDDFMDMNIILKMIRRHR